MVNKRCSNDFPLEQAFPCFLFGVLERNRKAISLVDTREPNKIMTTYFSILSVVIRPLIDESLSIALLLTDGENVRFEYSKEKLKLIKELISDEQYKLIRAKLKQFDAYFSINKIEDNSLFKVSESNNIIDNNYLSYLSNYSHNLISYTAPQTIDININETNFYTLFNKYIYHLTPAIQNKKFEIEDYVSENLYPKIQKNVNTDLEITPSQLHNLAANVHIDAIGKNGSIVCVDVINFSKYLPHLKNDIHRYVSLMDAFERSSYHKKGKYFIIGQEPDSSLVQNHNIWKHLRELDIFQYIDAKQELEKVEEYILQNEVTPFI